MRYRKIHWLAFSCILACVLFSQAASADCVPDSQCYCVGFDSGSMDLVPARVTACTADTVELVLVGEPYATQRDLHEGDKIESLPADEEIEVGRVGLFWLQTEPELSVRHWALEKDGHLGCLYYRTRDFVGPPMDDVAAAAVSKNCDTLMEELGVSANCDDTIEVGACASVSGRSCLPAWILLVPALILMRRRRLRHGPSLQGRT